MDELKKKYWREKVTAEITVSQVQQFAHEMGGSLSAADVAQFLNRSGLAQNMWMHIMQAGEQFIKSNLNVKVGAQPGKHAGDRAAMIQ